MKSWALAYLVGVAAFLLSNSLEKFCGLDGKGVRQFDDIDEAYVPFAALDPTDVIPVQVGTIRKLFLAPSAL